jgi:hypothetical protein
MMMMMMMSSSGGRHVLEPEPEQLDDYPGGPYDTTVLTRYHVHVTMMAADGEVR